jgi:hypothetical protein
LLTPARVQAAREALEALETRERRAAMLVRDADLRARLDATSAEVATLTGRLQLALVALRALEAEVYAGGLLHGGHISDITGLPSDFASALLRAIATAAPDVEWPYPAPGAVDERAGRRPERLGRIRDPRSETALPYGVSGVVDLVTGGFSSVARRPRNDPTRRTG